MANSTKIRGITIELNADTAGIMDGIKDLNASLSKTDKSLRDVDKLLKFDPSSTTLLAQQQEYLGQAIEQTEGKLRKQKELLESMKNADNAEETVESSKTIRADSIRPMAHCTNTARRQRMHPRRHSLWETSSRLISQAI